MELVEATADDLDALIVRWYGLAKGMEDYGEMNELDYVNVDDVPDDDFRARIDGDDIEDYLVVHNDETIGYVALREGHHPSRQYSQYLRIVDLAIDEEYRDRGHGTEVVTRVEEIARERGCDHLKVSCEWDNEGARRFYRDTGFQPKEIDYARPLE